MAASSQGADPPASPQTAAPHPRAAHITLIPCIREQNAQRVGNIKNPLSYLNVVQFGRRELRWGGVWGWERDPDRQNRQRKKDN